MYTYSHNTKYTAANCATKSGAAQQQARARGGQKFKQPGRGSATIGASGRNRPITRHPPPTSFSSWVAAHAPAPAGPPPSSSSSWVAAHAPAASASFTSVAAAEAEADAEAEPPNKGPPGASQYAPVSSCTIAPVRASSYKAVRWFHLRKRVAEAPGRWNPAPAEKQFSP